MRSVLLVVFAACTVGLGGASAYSPRAAFARAGAVQPSERLHTGTLIVVIPTGDGAVLAADSRATVSDGSVIDTEVKIVRSSDLPVAAFVTGLAAVTVRARGAPRSRARMEYDVAAILQRELDRLDQIPQEGDFRVIAESVAASVRRSPAAMEGKLKNQVTQIGVVTFRRGTSKTTVYTARLDMDAAGNLTVGILPVAETEGRVAVRTWLYGESGFAIAHVLRGAGRAGLSQDTRQFLNRRATVEEVDSHTAYAAAKDIIETVGRRMAEDQPDHVTVGGPTRGILVGAYGASVLDDGSWNGVALSR
jgi:hypothetical protein